MNYEQAQREIIKIIQSMALKHSVHHVFRDFTVLAACTISNSMDKQQWEKREEMYMRTIKKYNKKEADQFAKILGHVTLGLGNRLGDFMGELYMQLEISNKNSGQFFTPYDISKMMAEFLDFELDNGIIELNEPAVGSGGMVIAYAESMKKRGLNYQTQLKVICNDIDFEVVKMCYIQLSLVGIDAVVMQGNTLTPDMKMNEHWYTPMHLMNLAKKKQEERTMNVADRMKNIIKLEDREPKKEAVEVVPGQMSIFDLGVMQ